MSRTNALASLILGVALVAAGPIAAQTTTAPNATAPVPGANSFTESQAKERIESAGFSQVTNLRKDDQGIWHASAKKGETAVSVALDFRGNVVAN